MRVPIVPFVATIHTAKSVELGREQEEEALWHATHRGEWLEAVSGAIGAEPPPWKFVPLWGATWHWCDLTFIEPSVVKLDYGNFSRPTPCGFRQVVQHLSKHVAY